MREHKVDNYIGGAQIEQGAPAAAGCSGARAADAASVLYFLLFTKAKTLSSSTNSMPSAGNRLFILQ
jgi:hypothetical protein